MVLATLCFVVGPCRLFVTLNVKALGKDKIFFGGLVKGEEERGRIRGGFQTRGDGVQVLPTYGVHWSAWEFLWCTLAFDAKVQIDVL